MALNGSRRRPLVLVYEDLHWVDTLTEELLTSTGPQPPGRRHPPALHLPARLPGALAGPLLREADLAAAAQPQRERRRGPRGPGRRRAPRAARRGGRSRRAEGNPFFAQELARAFRDGHDEEAATAVPGTVHDVLAARIDLLPDAPRRLLRTASVIGREFSPLLLEPLWEEGSPLEPHLARAEAPGVRLRADRRRRAAVRLRARPHPRGRLRGPPGEHPPRAARGGRADARAAVRGPAGRGGRPPRPPLLEDRAERGRGRVPEPLGRQGRPGLRARRGRPGPRGGPAPRRAAPRRGAGATRARPGGAPGHARCTSRAASRSCRDLLLRHRPRVDALGDPQIAGEYYFWLGHDPRPGRGRRPASERFAARAIEEAGRAGDGATIGKARIVLAWEGFFTGRYAEGAEHARAAVAALEATEEWWWLSYALGWEAVNQMSLGGVRRRARARREVAGRSGASGRTRACRATAPG